MREIQHEGTDEVICPHCGYEHGDSWERGGNDLNASGEDECGGCGKPFKWERDFKIWYNTEKLEPK